MGVQENYEQQVKGRMWGVFALEGDEGSSPIAAFASLESAQNYLDHCQDDCSVDCGILRMDYYGTIWNSFDPDPKADGFLPFSPDV